LLLKQALNIFQFVVVENSSKIGKVLAQVPMVSISILHHILVAYAHAVQGVCKEIADIPNFKKNRQVLFST